jgi:hypothetical protein
MKGSRTFWSQKKRSLAAVRPILLASLLSVFGVDLYATDIYRWVDESGKTQMSDRVPEQYRAVAKRINTSRFELSEGQRQEAEIRAAKEKSLMLSKQVAEAPVSLSKDTSKSADPSQSSDCAQKWDEYYSSQNCLGPYVVTTPYGSKISPEGFAACPVVDSPYKSCEYDKRLSIK